MSDVAVRVEGLGKKFLIGHQKNGDLRNAFVHTVRGFISKKAAHQEEFWALKDLNFEIKRGEVVGIIGRNGAGKSTLLKILSRITDPTTGRFEIDGRVSSLLEVGTGFHMELTGRENIFLNGTILGMRRAEIKRKFDEIVDFSGVENFIDTPVKHYSSGMKVRLAFSVAAHLEPEILIIDEVLAVGDAEFQKKCLGKMDEVSKREGRTILFVSHNLAAVEHLCSSGLFLQRGSVVSIGKTRNAIAEYLAIKGSVSQANQDEVRLSDEVVVKSFALSQARLSSLDDLEYQLTFESMMPNRFTHLAILIYNHLNERIGIIDLRHETLFERSRDNRRFTVKGKIKRMPLLEGCYQCGLYVSSSLCQGDFFNLRRFEVVRPQQSFLPYADKYNGQLIFDNTFVFE